MTKAPRRRGRYTVATRTRTSRNGDAEELAGVSNGAEAIIAYENPYICSFTIEGVTPILWHRWNTEGIEEKANAKKGSAAKKTDDVESYVYRDEKGKIAIPGVYVHGSMIAAAKFRQDPRSPRKSAMDLYKAAVAPLTELASLGKAKWDYIDARRVTVQRAGITRRRPAFNAGWTASFDFAVNLPEYVGSMDFLDVLTLAGRVVGIADMRPTYGRFNVVRFESREV